jgi:hypothetical protein
MNAKLTFLEKWYMFWGMTYVVNLNPRSKEIHSLTSKHKSCQLDRISRKKYVTHRKALKLIKENGFNGCMFCWKVADNG